MNLVRWNQRKNLSPVDEFERLQNEINRLFDLDYQGSTGLFDRTASPAVDVIEREDSVIIRCDMPGIKKEDLDLSLAGNILTIKGEKKPETKKKKTKSYRNETWAGLFQRTISLPDGVDLGGRRIIKKKRVLEINVAKREEVRPRQIDVKVS